MDLTVAAAVGDCVVPDTAPWEFGIFTGAFVVVAAIVGTAMIPHFESTTFVSVKTAADFGVVGAKTWRGTAQAPPLNDKETTPLDTSGFLDFFGVGTMR